MDSIGRRCWAIAEGYIPSESSFSDPALISHETACMLNPGDRDADSRRAKVALLSTVAYAEP
jgi:hypothetical protein